MADVYFDTQGKYGEVIILDEYQGEISLVSGRKAKDGDKVYMEWCYPQDKDRKPRDKSVPWKVRLGDQATAVNFIRWLSARFGMGPDPGYTGTPDEDQIPF